MLNQSAGTESQAYRKSLHQNLRLSKEQLTAYLLLRQGLLCDLGWPRTCRVNQACLFLWSAGMNVHHSTPNEDLQQWNAMDTLA